jgi:hypothetical protein
VGYRRATDRRPRRRGRDRLPRPAPHQAGAIGRRLLRASGPIAPRLLLVDQPV